MTRKRTTPQQPELGKKRAEPNSYYFYKSRTHRKLTLFYICHLASFSPSILQRQPAPCAPLQPRRHQPASSRAGTLASPASSRPRQQHSSLPSHAQVIQSGSTSQVSTSSIHSSPPTIASGACLATRLPQRAERSLPEIGGHLHQSAGGPCPQRAVAAEPAPGPAAESRAGGGLSGQTGRPAGREASK